MVMDFDPFDIDTGFKDDFAPDDGADPGLKPLTDKELGLSFPKLPGMEVNPFMILDESGSIDEATIVDILDSF